MRVPLALLSGLVAVASAAAFLAGGADAPAARGGPPPARAYASVCRGKPGAALGEAVATVLERPYVDVAVIRVDWRRGPMGEGCCLEVLLPETCTLEEGEAEHVLPEGLDAGAFTVRVRHPLDRTSDVVLRFCARLGDAEVRRESYVRLWEAAP
jgi:hypothetical protein